MNQALVLGINDYPGTQNDLSGCVNDADDWEDLFKRVGGFNIVKLINSQVTRSNVKSYIESMIKEVGEDEWFALTYSGHGTYTVDMSGDEPDGYDEAIFLFDGMLIDDDIRESLSVANLLGYHINQAAFMDSCFSGTVTRKMVPSNVVRQPRFMIPTIYAPLYAMPVGLSRVKKFLSEEDMLDVLISGCSDKEYSYDAWFDNRPNGAFSYYATRSFQVGMTFKQWYDKIRESLPSDHYPQTPQLEGKDENKNAVVFGKSDVQPPEEQPEKESWFVKHWWVVVLGVGALIYLITDLVK